MPILAATTTTTFPVTATVVASCVTSATPLAFGTYAPQSTHDATSTISVNCTTGTGFTIALSQGLHGSGVSSRLMSDGGGNTLRYDLFRDAGRSQIWGETPGGDTVGGTGNSTAVNYTVYGRIPAGLTPPAGSYADTITVTVEY